MGELKMNDRVAWSEEHDAIIIANVIKAKNAGISNKIAFTAASEEIFVFDETERTDKAISMRFYYLQKAGKMDSLLVSDNPAQEENEFDMLGMFAEMKKIIKERDDLRSKYEDALTYKIQYEEIKRKLSKIERESVSFMELLRKR